jgi:polysaccharide export outer membrane protein
MAKVLARIAVLMGAIMLSGCYTDYGPVELAKDPPAAPSARTVQAGDRLKVTVYGEDGLNGVYDVDPAGSLTLPLAGTIRAAGRSRAELQREITARYRKSYLQDPQVSVEVVSYQPFYVSGQVKSPGAYAFKGPINVMSAIAMAGGETYRGSHSTVLIQHPGRPTWMEYPLTPAIMVEPGDLIRVPERYF